jgi:hypothetical protein
MVRQDKGQQAILAFLGEEHTTATQRPARSDQAEEKQCRLGEKAATSVTGQAEA